MFRVYRFQKFLLVYSKICARWKFTGFCCLQIGQGVARCGDEYDVSIRIPCVGWLEVNGGISKDRAMGLPCDLVRVFFFV